jgi:MoxR-like ATPase
VPKKSKAVQATDVDAVVPDSNFDLSYAQIRAVDKAMQHRPVAKPQAPLLTPATDEGAVKALIRAEMEDTGTRLGALLDSFETRCKTIEAEAFGQYLSKVHETALEVAREEAAKLAPVQRTLVAPNITAPVKLDGARHFAYDDVMESLTALGQVFISGPAGSGKSSMCHQIAQDLGLDYGFLSCTEGMSEAHLTGRMNMMGEYLPSDCVRILEKGGVLLLDEIDGANANTLVMLDELLSNGRMAIPNRHEAPYVDKHPQTLIICSANTWGTGGNAQYKRNALDAAFLDRFCAGKIEVGYDIERERSIAQECGIVSLLKKIWAVRENVATEKIERVVSTRWVVGAGKLKQVNPEKWTDGKLLSRLMTGWSAPEQAKALKGLNS